MGDTTETISAKKKGNAFDSGIWPWVMIAAVIIVAAVIRGRLLSIPLERDEGEYAYIAQQLLKGVPPYISGYSMKFPGIYAVYGLILRMFGETASGIHLGLLLVNTITIIVVYLLTKKLTGCVGGLAGAAVFACMSLVRPVLGLSANTEQFAILPALAGILLLYDIGDKHRYIRIMGGGLLLGLALVIKQHSFFLVLFAGTYLLYSEICQRRDSVKKVVTSQAVFWGCTAVPFAVTCLLLWKAGAFEKFWFWTITYARTYATAIPFYAAPIIFWKQFIRLAESSAPFMLLALAGLIGAIIRNSYRDKAVFMTGFVIFSLLCVCPGFYFRSHYFIFLLPFLAVLAGAGLAEFNNLPTRHLLAGRYRRFILITAVCLISIGYCLYGQRTYLFSNTPAKVCRLLYGANPFVESPTIGDFIRANTGPNDTIAVIGSEPEIYFYSDRRSATGYIYTYPLMESHNYAGIMQNEMEREIDAARPKIIVLVNVYSSWLSTKKSSMDILKWTYWYLDKNYEAVGIIEILPTWETVYLWNEQAKHYKTAGEDWIAVFRQK